MNILGIDPSTDGYAYTVLEYHAEKYTWYSGTRVRFTTFTELIAHFEQLLAAFKPELVGVECVAPYTAQAAVLPYLFKMQLIVGVLKGMHPTTYLIPANGRGNQKHGGWRPYLFGISRPKKPQTWDKLVARDLPLLVRGIPRRTNTHTRDAAMIALALSRATRNDELTSAGAWLELVEKGQDNELLVD